MAKGAKTGGRTKGTPNKLTKAFRDSVLIAYEGIGGDESLIVWAKENQTEFYKIASRLIPSEIVGPGENGEHTVINRVEEHIIDPTR